MKRGKSQQRSTFLTAVLWTLDSRITYLYYVRSSRGKPPLEKTMISYGGGLITVVLQVVVKHRKTMDSHINPSALTEEIGRYSTSDKMV